MSDLIDRQKAVDAVLGLSEKMKNEMLFIDAIVDEIENLPSAEPERKWIPCSEALPKMKEVVLITNGKGHVTYGQYQGTFRNNNNEWFWRHKTLETVFAWMPLPEPWGGE